MKKIKESVAICLALIILMAIPAMTMAAVKIGFVNNNIWLSKDAPIEKEQLKIYSIIVNSDASDIEGDISFYDNNQLIGTASHFVLQAGSSRVMNIDWQAIGGNHQFKAVISNALSIMASGAKNPISGNVTTQTEVVFIDVDSDGDGVPNKEEVANGTNPNNPDTDNDGSNDLSENQNGTNPNNPDTDGDGAKDGTDTAPTDPASGVDTDHDGVTDEKDSDIDNDGLYNFEEIKIGTNPKKFDTDGDGVGDKEDYYPLNANKSKKEVVVAEQEAVIKSAANPVNTATESIENLVSNSIASSQTDNDSGATAADQSQVLGEKVYGEDGLRGGENKADSRSFLPNFSFLSSGVIVKILASLSLLFLIIAIIFLILSKMEEKTKK